MSDVKVFTKILSNGFSVIVDGKTYETGYPQKVWQNFPQALKEQLAESAAYFFTVHLSFFKKGTINYLFPPPLANNLFFQGLFYSVPELSVKDPEKGYKSSNLLKNFFNSGYQISFSGVSKGYSAPIPKSEPKTAVIPFSLGKDSLLTYAICRELGYKIQNYYLAEPSCAFENINKSRLIGEFVKEFRSEVIVFPLELGKLRQNNVTQWGWDMLLMQYTLLLLPYVYFSKTEYFFWSNEQSTNEVVFDREGYRVNVSFEQNYGWTQQMNNLLRMFSLPTVLSSILEPLQEIVILYILHKRYPQIGKYQLSCLNEHRKAEKQRWCCACYECARVYLFLKALGVKPETVGFSENMLNTNDIKLFSILHEKWPGDEEIIKDSHYAERLLAFYLAYKRGVKGKIMKVFKSKYLLHTEKIIRKIYAKYFRIYPSKTIPQELLKKITTIYQSELSKLKEELTPYL